MAIPESEIIRCADGWIACPPVGASLLCSTQVDAMEAHAALITAFENGRRHEQYEMERQADG